MSEIVPILLAVVAASVVGSLHCAGMCGGLVLFAVSGDGTLRRRTPLHVAYHGGRGVAYMLLGVAAGAIGAAADLTTTLNSNMRTSAVVAGAAMILLGFIALAQNVGLARVFNRLPGPIQKTAENAHRWAFGLPPMHRALMVGVLTPLLPCGWLYAFVIVAAGTGSPLLGGLVMAAFWLGTVPLMGALGLGLSTVTGPLRQKLPALTSVIVIGLGVLTAMGRVNLPSAVAPSLGNGDASDRLRAVSEGGHEILPCCAPGEAMFEEGLFE